MTLFGERVASLGERVASLGERVASLGERVASLDRRLSAIWPSEDRAHDMRRRTQATLYDIHDALAAYQTDPSPKKHALLLVEIGNAMLTLGRMALAVGSSSALTPLQIAVAKAEERVAIFEQLAETAAPDTPVANLWSQTASMTGWPAE